MSTRAELTIHAEALEGLPADVAARLRTGLGLDRGLLRITCQDERALSQNRARCAERLAAMVESALATPPPPRLATKPSAAARTQRVATKRTRGAVKRLRQPPDDTA